MLGLRFPARSAAHQRSRAYRRGLDLFATLLFHEMAELSLHRFESVVHNFAQRIVCAIIQLFFIRHEFVSGWDSHIDPHTKLISFVMRVVRLLDSDIAAADVIAKMIKSRCFCEY
jgi:hypothetical protein